MSLRLIYGRGGSGKSHYCLQDIKEKIKENGKDSNKTRNKLVLMVPEQYSFQSERNLLKVVGVTGIIQAEVLSFKRLAHRVFNEVGGLTLKRISDPGKAMLIYNIMEELSSELKIFARVSKQQGFIDIVAETIKEFKRYNITPEIIDTSLKNLEDQELIYKLEDLKRIFEKFQEALHKEYIDSEDEITLLSGKLDESTAYDGAEIWIDEFSIFTPQQYLVLEKLLKKCKRVNITLAGDGIAAGEDIDNTDIFSVTKKTTRKLLKLAQDNNIKVEKPINLNDRNNPRFGDNPELKHIERYFYSSPYSYYKNQVKNLRIYKAFNNYEEIEVVAGILLGWSGMKAIDTGI